MKKSNLFLLLLMALIVMSCSKDETTMSIPQESNAIEFGTYVGRDAQTRAPVLDDAALKGTKDYYKDGFGVFAHYTGTTAYATPTTTPNFMYNQQVKFADSKWGYTPVKYWPNNTGDLVSFFAYAPYGNTNIDVANAAVGDPALTFTVNGTVKDQADLVWGVNETGGLPFLNQTKQSITGDIKFTFKHALARIGFNVEAMVDLVNTEGTGTTPDGDTANGTTDGATKIVVTQVQLIGKFYESGVLNLNSTATSTTPIVSVPNWGTLLLPEDLEERTFELNATGSNFADATDVGFDDLAKTFGQDVTNAKEKLNADDSYLMVIPQAFADNKIKIRVTYDVITKDDDLGTGQSKVKNVITSDEFTFDFAGGKAYTFNLHLGMTSVKFDADVTGWDEQTGTVVNVPINTN